MPPPLEEQAAEIMERFRWKTVHKVMLCLNWCWDDANEPPTLADIKKHGQALLRRACEEPPGDYVRECGGFRVERRGGVLELCFIVFGWDGR